VILEHSVLGLHTCLVPVLLSSPLLSCIPCLGSALQYILCTCSVHSFPVCIMSTSILASLRCTCFVIARQILSTSCRHSGQTPHRPRRTLRPTDRNSWAEPAGSEGYWQAFRIAGEDLGLDITQEEVEGHIERTSGINNYRESIASSPTTCVSTPSEPSIIRPRPSPYQLSRICRDPPRKARDRTRFET
jgi:hypothetical protein